MILNQVLDKAIRQPPSSLKEQIRTKRRRINSEGVHRRLLQIKTRLSLHKVKVLNRTLLASFVMVLTLRGKRPKREKLNVIWDGDNKEDKG